MANVGFASLQVIPSFRGVEASLASGVAGPSKAAGAKAGGLFGSGFSSTLAKVAGPAAVAGVGVALFKLGSSFDEEFDKIRVGTGATGDVLKGLEGSFKTVLSGTAASFGDTGTAIADINTRLGLTGKPLETLSQQILNLSHITKTDLGTNVDNITRVFGDWQIATDKQSGSVDELFRAAQASGIGLDDLSSSVVQFGAPLRNLGFGFDESLALLAQFNKTGVNTDTVIAGLKKGVGTLAKAGEDVPSTFKRIVGEITKLGPGSEATRKAIELFGQRAGPDLADAIAGGKFEIGDMLKAISGGKDTVASATKDTEDFGEKWTKIKNRVFVGLEPLASKLFDAVGKGMDNLGPIIDTVVTGFSALQAAFSGEGVTSDGFVGFMEQVGVALRDAFDAAKPFIDYVRKHFKAALLVAGIALGALVSPLGLLGVALFAAWVKFKGFRDVVKTVIDFLVTNVPPTFKAIQQVITVAVNAIGDVFGALVGWTQDHWAAISEAVGHVVHVIEDVIGAFVAAVKAVWSVWGDDLLKIASAVFDQIRNVIETAINVVKDVIDVALSLINGDWGDAWNGLKTLVSDVWDGIKTTVSNGVDAILGLIGGIGDTISTIGATLFDGLKSAFKAAINFVIDGWNSLEFKIPGFDPPGPGPKFGGFTLGVPDIPRLHAGGMFDSGRGEGLALLSDGERVLSPSQTREFDKAGASTGDVHLHVTQLPGEDQVSAGMRELKYHRTLQLAVGNR